MLRINDNRLTKVIYVGVIGNEERVNFSAVRELLIGNNISTEEEQIFVQHRVILSKVWKTYFFKNNI